MKKIGIPAWSVGENSLGVGKSYINFIEELGGTPIILYPSNPIDQSLDLLLLSGGADVNPMRYGEFPKVFTGAPNLALEAFDTMVLSHYINTGVPIFGICRGHQTLNVHFGGKLIQNMSHETNESHRSELVHGVYSLPGADNIPEFEVNSLHHQAVHYKHGLSPEMIALLLHKSINKKDPKKNYTDFTVEAMRHKELPIYSVQWHPEEIFDKWSLDTISMLLNLGYSTRKLSTPHDQKKEKPETKESEISNRIPR